MHALLYRSRARPGLLASDLNGIIATAEDRNRQLDVTGLLLYGQLQAVAGAPGEFVQWIEGEESVVEGLFESIAGDDRHFDVEVLGRGTVPELTGGRLETVGGRLFPAWSMGLVRLAELPATLDGFRRFADEWDGDVLAQAA